MSQSISKFRLPSKLADKGICFKASAEKAWLLYEFPFSLNPDDKPNVAQTFRTIHHYIQQVEKTSSNQIQRKVDGTFKRQQNKAHQIPISWGNYASQKNCLYENFV